MPGTPRRQRKNVEYIRQKLHELGALIRRARPQPSKTATYSSACWEELIDYVEQAEVSAGEIVDLLDDRIGDTDAIARNKPLRLPDEDQDHGAGRARVPYRPPSSGYDDHDHCSGNVAAPPPPPPPPPSK